MKKQKKDTIGEVIQVALPLPLRQTFDYLLALEHGSVKNGCRVDVPLHKRRLTGLVIKKTTFADIPQATLRPIYSVIDSEPSVKPKLLSFLKWAADYYHHPIGEVIHAALPRAIRGRQPIQPRTPLRYCLTAV